MIWASDMENGKSKRTWSYLQPPAAYGLPPCECGNTEVQWSEYVGHLWCEKCQKDFVPAHGGIFDGPIPARLAALMGVKFDRVILETGKIERFDAETGQYKAAA